MTCRQEAPAGTPGAAHATIWLTEDSGYPHSASRTAKCKFQNNIDFYSTALPSRTKAALKVSWLAVRKSWCCEQVGCCHCLLQVLVLCRHYRASPASACRSEQSLTSLAIFIQKPGMADVLDPAAQKNAESADQRARQRQKHARRRLINNNQSLLLSTYRRVSATITDRIIDE